MLSVRQPFCSPCVICIMFHLLFQFFIVFLFIFFWSRLWHLQQSIVPGSPQLTKRFFQKSFRFSAMKHPKTTSKRLNKKKVREPFHLFFRLIPEVFFHRAHRQSLPLGRFSGGRATQKVAQTKTQLGRVSFMSSAEAGPAAAGPATAVTKPGGFEGTALLGKDKHVVELTLSYVRGGGGFVSEMVDGTTIL